jgi:Mn2+/Fe2+ NRAMP family transporter
MKTLGLTILTTLLHLVCCLFPISLLGFNFLSFLSLSDTSKQLLMGFQIIIFGFLLLKIRSRNKQKAGSFREKILTWINLVLIVFSFYLNVYEPLHTEKQKMMKARIERLKR